MLAPNSDLTSSYLTKNSLELDGKLDRSRYSIRSAVNPLPSVINFGVGPAGYAGMHPHRRRLGARRVALNDPSGSPGRRDPGRAEEAAELRRRRRAQNA